ncbi:MAG: hypothetical protein NTV23_07240 [Propionibacteriales bacterium]|nr:hypothetical protein [Propionibacteriales bacterium]
MNTQVMWQRRTLVNVVASLLFVAAVVGGLVQIGKRSTDQVGATQASALVAAQVEALAVYTVDPANVEAQVDDVINGATGAFLATYSAQRDLLIRNVKARKQVLTAVVPDDGTAIAHYAAGEAVVLVAINVTAREAGTPMTTPYRLRLTMQRVGGLWKAATLDTLPAEAGPGIYIAGDLPGGNAQILSAAAKAVEVMYSYDYRAAASQRKAFVPLVTERFAPIFARTYATNSTAAATKLSVVDSYARAVGLVVRDQDRARCLVYLDQVVTIAGKTTPVATRLFVDLQRVDGSWLVDGLSAP